MAGNCILKANATNQILHWPYHTFRRVKYFVKKNRNELTKVNIDALPAEQARKIQKVEAKMLRDEAERLATQYDKQGKISDMSKEFRALVSEMRSNFAS